MPLIQGTCKIETKLVKTPSQSFSHNIDLLQPSHINKSEVLYQELDHIQQDSLIFFLPFKNSSFPFQPNHISNNPQTKFPQSYKQQPLNKILLFLLSFLFLSFCKILDFSTIKLCAQLEGSNDLRRG